MGNELLQPSSLGPVRLVRFDRAERRNALSRQLLDELRAELEADDADPDVRGVVLTGSHEAFSTGADLQEALEASSIDDALRYLRDLRQVLALIESMSKPVVAAIEGYCFTGGLELALACDLRFAGSNARFAVTSAKIGSMPGMGATQRLPRLVGSAHAKDMLFTAREVGADEAAAMGLVIRVPDDVSVVDHAVRWVESTAERAPLSVWMTKFAVNTGLQTDLSAALDLELALSTLLFGSDDKAEGMRAFLEKRPPRFEGS